MDKEIEQLSLGFDLLNNDKIYILISLQERWFNRLVSGEKTYEFRRKFVKTESTVFIYVTNPVGKICGKAEFDKPIIAPIEEIAKIAESQLEGAGQRTIEYMKNQEIGFAMPIKKFVQVKPISLQEIKKSFPEFVAPQSYIILNKKSELLDYLNKLEELK